MRLQKVFCHANNAKRVAGRVTGVRGQVRQVSLTGGGEEYKALKLLKESRGNQAVRVIGQRPEPSVALWSNSEVGVRII